MKQTNRKQSYIDQKLFSESKMILVWQTFTHETCKIMKNPEGYPKNSYRDLQGSYQGLDIFGRVKYTRLNIII